MYDKNERSMRLYSSGDFTKKVRLKTDSLPCLFEFFGNILPNFSACANSFYNELSKCLATKRYIIKDIRQDFGKQTEIKRIKIKAFQIS
jgi:hypothetical protein